MALTALSLLTHGWHHPGLVEVEVCASPVLTSVVEVRPVLRGTVPAVVEGPAGVPVVLSAEELRPEIVQAQGPEVQTGGDTPTVISSEELKPVIRKIEEE